ncbi:universal stress protein [Fodinicola acaciae]|uniref:universal stress protein n=1 Tax=Fodinicola acaciae TaxID=2681555 RepID=UPI0013D67AE6|nr:universal stress protein [Fodinicola acaciae]
MSSAFGQRRGVDGTIVVGVSGSPASIGALRWAARLGGPVLAVLVFRPVTIAAGPAPAVTMASGEYAGLLADIVRAEGLTSVVRAVVAEGAPGEKLVEMTGQAAMLVLGQPARHGPGLSSPDSVAAHCARHASCPVLIVPAARDLGAIDPRAMVRIGRG